MSEPRSIHDNLRICVVGCGSIGKRHIRNLLALKAGEILGFDVRGDRRSEVVSHFGIPVFATLDDVWALQPNVAIIAVPNRLHVPLALQAAEHGCHLMIEKPLSDSLSDVGRLAAIVADKGLITLVGCNMRFTPGVRKMHELLAQRSVGTVISARAAAGQYLPDWHPWENYRHSYSARRDLGGGIILDAIHELDYLRWLCGEVTDVSCMAAKLSHLEIQTEDIACMLLRFASGVLGEVHLDYVRREYHRSCEIIGDEGTLSWDFTSGSVTLTCGKGGHRQVFERNPEWQINDMYVDEMRHFLACLRGETTPWSDLQEGRRVLEIALAAKAAALTGKMTSTGHEPVSTKRVVAVVQARMGSSRLPGKVLVDVAGKPMLSHVVSRIRHSRSVDQVVIATTTNPGDDVVAEFCASNGIDYFRGSEADVLDRYYGAAKAYGAEVVVRITADCPLIDPDVIDSVVEVFRDGEYDYVSNTLQHSFPDGLDTEVFSLAALERAWRTAKLPSEREHVTPFLKDSANFRVRNVAASDLHFSGSPGLRWTVDESQDLEFVRQVYSRMNGMQEFGAADILRLLEKEPQLMAINHGIIRNEGYYKSLILGEQVAPRERRLERSQELKKRAQSLIPSCSQTFSKSPSQFVQGVAPVFVEKGAGCRIYDVDGNEYIDYASALGPVLLGYSHAAVNEAVKRQMEDGVVFSLPHPLEIEVAEALVELIPCAEMVRFGKNGSDVTSAAVRVARAFTGRDVIAACGYHGWQDWYIGTTTRRLGVPEAVQDLTKTFSYNDIASLDRVFEENKGRVAAVILEPIGVIEPKNNFLREVRDRARREGALLIFDEVITGFRLSMGGAQQHFDVMPDLACVGKAMGNGMPISAVVGRREVMQMFDEVFFSFTFGGETLSLAAAKATIEFMRENRVIEHLWEVGERIRDGYNVLARDNNVGWMTECIGLPPRTAVIFKDRDGAESLEYKSLFQQECFKRGVLFNGGHMMSYAHKQTDVDYTLRVYSAAMRILAEAADKGNVRELLEGDPVQPVFRRA